MSYKIKTNTASNWTANGTTHADLTCILLSDILAALNALNSTLSCYRVREMADATKRIDERLKRKGLSLAKRNRK